MISKNKQNLVAYFSMEIAFDERLSNYAGGLGILAGDLLRSAADQKIPMIGMTLLNRSGYFKQTIGRDGGQKSAPEKNNLHLLEKLKTKVTIFIGKDKIVVGAWRYFLRGESGKVPIYFLDTDFLENKPAHRKLCDQLYGGDHLYRLKQEIVLGRGGIKILEALKAKPDKFHINEGHGAFALVELFLQDKEKNLTALKKRCIFTTHSPIKEANDIFTLAEVKNNFPDFPLLKGLADNDNLNMAKIAMHFSGHINGVSKKHAEISREIFVEPRIKAITNGIHVGFWASDEMRALYDQYFPKWRTNNKLISRKNLPEEDIWSCHLEAKRSLLARVLSLNGEFLSLNDFTIVIARRFAPYKRSALLLENMGRLLKIQKKCGPIQIIYAGKAHPKDLAGQKIIKEIISLKKKYHGKISITFLENYDLNLAKLLVAGADLWLNTPLPPNEASGTSGMKAAINGVPQLSTLDGWWLEGYKEGLTGWKIDSINNYSDNVAMLDVLENKILSIFYHNPKKWRKIMSSTIRLNAYRFSSERAIKDYQKIMYEK
ncbi:MAG: alpha-glucan family phosphorylase [Candidatus Falkowbacteria bacterium]|nr:alpha-glucan family phosphorylase [Candidatus Falkowbacteria bacterium]